MKAVAAGAGSVPRRTLRVKLRKKSTLALRCTCTQEASVCSAYISAVLFSLVRGPTPTADGADRTLRRNTETIKCDRNGSGCVSREEYVAFSAREGVPTSVAETMFFQADVHGRGKLSAAAALGSTNKPVFKYLPEPAHGAV